MIVIPGEIYLKGSPQDEPGRNHDEDDQAGPGGTQVRVSVPAFALGTHEISNREFGQFLAETGYEMRSGCIADLHHDGRYQSHSEPRWENTGRPFEDDFPE